MSYEACYTVPGCWLDISLTVLLPLACFAAKSMLFGELCAGGAKDERERGLTSYSLLTVQLLLLFAGTWLLLRSRPGCRTYQVWFRYLVVRMPAGYCATTVAGFCGRGGGEVVLLSFVMGFSGGEVCL